jgi:hypothetical protein
MVAPVLLLARAGSAGPMGLANVEPRSLDLALPFFGWLGFRTRGPHEIGAWVLPVFALVGMVAAWRRLHHAALLLLLTAAVPTLVLVLAPTRHAFYVRYAIQCLPVLEVLAAVAVAWLASRLPRAPSALAQLAAAGGVVALSVGPINEFYHEQRTPFLCFQALMRDLGRPGDRVTFVFTDVPHFLKLSELAMSPFIDRWLTFNVLNAADPVHMGDHTWQVQWLDDSTRAPEKRDLLALPTISGMTRPELDILGESAYSGLVVRLPSRFSKHSDLLEQAIARAVARCPLVVTSRLPATANQNTPHRSK